MSISTLQLSDTANQGLQTMPKPQSTSQQDSAIQSAISSLLLSIEEGSTAATTSLTGTHHIKPLRYAIPQRQTRAVTRSNVYTEFMYMKKPKLRTLARGVKAQRNSSLTQMGKDATPRHDVHSIHSDTIQAKIGRPNTEAPSPTTTLDQFRARLSRSSVTKHRQPSKRDLKVQRLPFPGEPMSPSKQRVSGKSSSYGWRWVAARKWRVHVSQCRERSSSLSRVTSVGDLEFQPGLKVEEAGAGGAEIAVHGLVCPALR